MFVASNRRWQRAARRRRGVRGFTFLEIMLVVMILGMLMAFAVPDFRSFERRSTVEASARQLVGIFRHARSQAIATGAYTFVDFDFDDDTNSFTFGTKADDEDADRRRNRRRDDDDSTLHEYKFPDMTSVGHFSVPEEHAHLIYDGGRKARVYFYPDGTATPAHVVLQQVRPAKRGDGLRVRYYTIEIYRATGLTKSYYGLPAEDDPDQSLPAAPPLAGRRDEERSLQRSLRVLRDGVG